MLEHLRHCNWLSMLAIGFLLAVQLLAGCSKPAKSTVTDADKTVPNTDVADVQESNSDESRGTQRDESSSNNTSQKAARISVEESGLPARPVGQAAIGSKQPSGGNTAGIKLGSAQESGDKQTKNQPHQAHNESQTRDPVAAKKLGNELLAQAAKAANDGKMSQAFQSALQAWETTRNCVDAPDCQAIATRALELAEEYGEAANRSVDKSSDRKPITVK